MSYREMRSFTEMMRALGFNRIISMENFRTPNFPLVAEILRWLVNRYVSNADIPLCIDTEQDRIIFVKTIVHFMATNAHIRLNTKKIYQADGYAVKEMLKVSVLLYNAMKRDPFEDDLPETSIMDVFDMTRVKELKDARQLSSQITSHGARLYDLLKREVTLREVRQTSIGRQLEIVVVERGVRNTTAGVEQEIQRTLKGLEDIAADEANLEAKVQKKQSELERNRKRLSTLQSVRPAYMDEYEELERDLSLLYQQYLTRYRNLAFSEAQYEELVRSEAERQEETELSLRKVAEELREIDRAQLLQKMSAEDEDDFRGLLDNDDGEDSSEGDDDDDDDDDDNDANAIEMAKGGMGVVGLPAGRGGGRGGKAALVRAAEDDDEVTDIDDDEDSDEDDEDQDDDDDEDDIDIDNEMATMGRPSASRSARPTGASRRGRPLQTTGDSDEDF